VSGVIEALLMVALVASVLAVIQTTYIPQIMQQREADHMDLVSNQFSYMKSMIDIQTMTKSKAPIFSVITLGTNQLPYFITAPSTGQITISNNRSGNITIGGTKIVDITAIDYDAFNSYFVRQNYILEGGGIIVMQPEGTPVMRVDPAISISDTGTRYHVYLNLTGIINREAKISISGLEKCVIRTNYSHTIVPFGSPFSISGSVVMRLNTDYPEAWYGSLNNTVGKFVDLSLYPDNNPTCVQMKQLDKPIDLYIVENYIEAQIGPGWVIG
jgi:hypothetical protein